MSIDTGEYDARKTVLSSEEAQDEVFRKHRERIRKMKNKYVVMDFEPSEGMTLYGVFDTHDEAVEWAEEYKTHAISWFVVNINDHEETAELIKGMRGE